MKTKEINMLETEAVKNLSDYFNEKRGREERYASFDYCFNYFQEKYREGEIKEISNEKNIQHSCLQLGFYLASWGMYRGSTFLLQKSVKVYEPLIEYIASPECNVWDIDIDSYKKGNNIKNLIDCGQRIAEKLGKHTIEKSNGTLVEKEATDTLVTKIMMGVFGNVPAFDTYFKDGSNLDTFEESSLHEIHRFYDKYEKIINNKANETKTFEFEYVVNNEIKDGTGIPYTKAKVIDMIFFAKGYEDGRLAKIKKNADNSVVHNPSGT